MKILFGFAMLALILTALDAQARVGETLPECETRYGQPSSLDSKEFPPDFTRDLGSVYVFHPDGWEILCCFLDGVCIQQCYRKPLKDTYRMFIVDDEQAIIKEAESGGQAWEQSGSFTFSSTDPKTGFKTDSRSIRWSRPDGTYLTVGNHQTQIIVVSPVWYPASQEAQAKATAKRLAKLKKF